MSYIVQSKGTDYRSDTVVAPTGYYRKRGGSIIKDGTPSPEMRLLSDAYFFATHRAAARVAFPIIREVNYE